MSKKKPRLVWEDPPKVDTAPAPSIDWSQALAPLAQKKGRGRWARVFTGSPTEAQQVYNHLRQENPEGWEFQVFPFDYVVSGVWARKL